MKTQQRVHCTMSMHINFDGRTFKGQNNEKLIIQTKIIGEKNVFRLQKLHVHRTLEVYNDYNYVVLVVIIILYNQSSSLTEWPTPNTTTDGVTEDQVLQLITKALHDYSADQIARFDYALESAGGAVVDNSETFDPSNTQAQLFGYTLPLTLSRMPREAVIQVCGRGYC